jgi:trimeric autotransporter adhesin
MRYASLAVLLTLALPLAAQELVHMFPVTPPTGYTLPKYGFFPAGDRAFFVSSTPNEGEEPWVTDGTSNGTFPLGDFSPGSLNSHLMAAFRLGDAYFLFIESTDSARTGLYRSDGTRRGTRLIQTFEARWSPTNLRFAVAEDRVFIARLGELWVSDGTKQGTRMLRAAQSGSPGQIVSVGREAYFIDHYQAHTELWVSDGTVAGTRRVMNVTNARSSPSSFAPMIAHGNSVVLRVNFGAGEALWQSDGTVAGTLQLSDVWPVPVKPFSDGNRLYVIAEGELHVYDGTPNSFTLLHSAFSVYKPVAVNGHVFFGSLSSQFAQPEYWRTDGAPGGTYQFSSSGPRAIQPVVLGDVVLYGRMISLNPGRAQFWRTDGTTSGTYQVSSSVEIRPDYFNGGIDWIAPIGDRVVFPGSIGSGHHSLWVSDGTTEETHLLTSSAQGGSGLPDYTMHFGVTLAAHEGRWSSALLMAGVINQNLEVWRNTSGAGGMSLQANISGVGGFSPQIETAGENVFIQTDEFGDSTLLVSRAQGPFRAISDIAPQVPAQVRMLGTIGSRCLFWTNGDGTLADIWQTDGTQSGTRVVANVYIGVFSAGARPMFNGPDAVFFFVSNSVVPGLWRSDGTQAGTYRIVAATSVSTETYHFPPLAASLEEEPFQPVIRGNEVFFQAAFYPGNGFGLWRTDGTAPGTFQLKEFGQNPEFASFYSPTSLGMLDGVIYFCGHDDEHGNELWRSDGTREGTVRFKDIAPGPESSLPAHFVEFQGRLYFTAWTPEHGRELWVTDGTASGTRLLKDIFPGPASSLPGPLVVWEDRLNFAAFHPDHGVEIWRSNGTASGTLMGADVYSGPVGSSPRQLTPVGNKLYFTAYTPQYGRQLYVIDRSGSRTGGCTVVGQRRLDARLLLPLVLLALLSAMRISARRERCA